jgi:hypothetical protein
MAIITMFQWGLRDDIKTLLLNLPKPTTLSKAITQVIDFDNWLFEQRQERWGTSTPEPMQIDISRVRKLTEEEKERRRREHLCFYCGGKDHSLNNCPLKLQGPKVHKLRYTSSTYEPRHEEIESENNNNQPH